MIMADDYGDDLDALTSLLDEEDNPYDDGDPFSVKSGDAQKVSQEVKRRQVNTSQGKNATNSGSGEESKDESKSKQELLEELQRMREQLSQFQGGTPQTSSQTKMSPKESFSSALFQDPKPKTADTKKASPKSETSKKEPTQNGLDRNDNLFGDSDDDEDGLSDLFDCEFDNKTDTTRVTPQKAGSLFKKSNQRLAHTPKTNAAPPKKVSPYKCNLCDKTFDDRQAMTVHEFKHKVVHPYSCDVCGKSFTDKLQLQTHRRTHSAKSSEKTDKRSSRPDTGTSSSSSSVNDGRRSSVGNGTSTNRLVDGGKGRGSGLGIGGSSGASSLKSVPQIGSGVKRKPQGSEEAVCETEYFSKIRIINPLVSSATMKERMKDRKMIRMSILKHYSRTGDLEGDWVTMGVIIRKISKQDSKGKTYTTWIMNDLSDLEENVVLHLFGKVHDEHWKTAEGSVIGVLNASLLDNKDNSNYKSSDDVRIKVDHPQKLLLLGKSKDFGRCKGTRKDGQACSKIVNVGECQHCPYHVAAEFKKSGSKRTDLSSSYSGVTPKSYMKKLQKDNFIYGGKSVGMASFSIAGGGVTSQSKMTKHFKSNPLNLKSLGVKGADALVEEAKTSVMTLHGRSQQENDTMVQVSGATREFTDMLKAPSSGSQNLMRHMVTVEQSTNIVSTISAKDLLKQHRQDMASKRSSRPPSFGQSSQASRSGHSQSSTPKSSRSTSFGQSTQSSRSSQSPSSSTLKSSRQKLLTESTKHNVTTNTTTTSSSSSSTPERDFTPKLGKGWSGGADIDLDDVSPPKFGAGGIVPSGRGGARSGKGKLSTLLAKQKALAMVRQKGGIKKEDPNAVKKSIDERKKEAMKRKAHENWKDDSPDDLDPDADVTVTARPGKKRKTFMGQELDLSQDEMEKILKAKSSHAGLLAEHEAELLDTYFKEMERKEGIENKMDSVRELKRKVVSCKECSFTWFGPSDMCKREKHTLRWHEATQRFFRCRDCNSRCIAFDRLPNKTCRSCGGFNYERATMLKDRDGPKLGGETLKLRGDEEKWIM